VDRVQSGLTKLAFAITTGLQCATFHALNQENANLRTDLCNATSIISDLGDLQIPRISSQERTLLEQNGFAGEIGAAGLTVCFALSGIRDLRRRRED